MKLHARLKAIRFHDISALGREIKGSPLGFDVNRQWQAPDIKGQFATWLLDQPWADPMKIEALLPEYEKQAQDYYAKKGKPGRPRGYSPNRSVATPVVRVETDVPMPVADAGQNALTPEDEKQGENTTLIEMGVQKVRVIAREEAGKLDHNWQLAANARLAEIKAFCEGLENKINLARPVLVTVKNGDVTSTAKIGRQHKHFLTLLKLAATHDHQGNGLNIWLTGPAGSGKTTAAENVAKALDVPFHFTGAVDNEYKLLGFVDAKGQTVRTVFREAYENGGVFLLDEVDGCHPGALLALNAALANGHCDFPDGNITRHKDCIMMAAANTWGTGATHEYVGRTKLDSASLDRFVMLEWAYDEELERGIANNDTWVSKVQAIRRRVAEHGIKHIVSPRASYLGAMMLAAGFDEPTVTDMVIRKGLPLESWNRVKGN